MVDRLTDRSRPVPGGAGAGPAVLPDHDRRPILVFDGHCVLCSGWARLVMRLDRAGRIRLCAAQSPRGQALYRRHGLDPVDFNTNVLEEDGRAHVKLGVTIRVAELLGPPWSALRILRLVPRPLQDWVYDRIARNRFALFGRRDSCFVPTSAERDRFV